MAGSGSGGCHNTSGSREFRVSRDVKSETESKRAKVTQIQQRRPTEVVPRLSHANLHIACILCDL